MIVIPSKTGPDKPIYFGGFGRMGTWEVPYTEEQAEKLKRMLDNKTSDNYSITLLLKNMGGLVGDDRLWDKLSDIEEEAYERSVLCVKTYIKSLMKAYENTPDGFNDTFEPKAIKILKSIEIERVEAAIGKGAGI